MSEKLSAEREEASTTSESAPKASSSRLRAVGVVSLATMLSRILGLVRDMVFAALFRRAATDAYAVAFMLPNLLRRLLAEGILSTAFIPVFTSYLDEEDSVKERVYGSVFGAFFILLVLTTIVGVWFAPWLVKVFAPGFSAERFALAVYLTRWMFPFILLVGLASFWTGILHTYRHFTAPAFGPLLLNIGIISCALTMRNLFPANFAITAMAIGVLVGGVLQLILQVMALARLGVKVRFLIDFKHPALKEILWLMGPTLLGLGVYQLNMLVSSMIASLLAKGSITYIYCSNRLMELPLGVIAVAFATVNLPTLSAKADSKDWEGFHETLLFGVRGVLFACIPAAFGLDMVREPIIGVLFQRGLFTYVDTLKCAAIFAPAAFGLIFVGALRNLTPAFYAMKDTKTPVKIAFVGFIFNALCSVAFAFAFQVKSVPFALGWGLGATGLTLANTCSALLSVGLSLWLLHRKIGPFEISGVWKSAGRVLLASLAMSVVLWFLVPLGPWTKGSFVLRATWLAGLIAIGGSVFVVIAYLLRVPELHQAVQKIRRKL